MPAVANASGRSTLARFFAQRTIPGVARSVGVCGLGNMGGAFAGRLAEAFTVVGFDPDAQRAGKTGVRAADDLAGLVAEAEVIVLFLPAPAVSQAVVTSLAAAASPGTL